jgi:phage terminase Nu1 subunit (DNA packaging protein)
MIVADLEVSDVELAALVDLTPRRIRQLATEGKLVRVGRNRFKLGDSVRALLAEAAENNEGSELQKERLRKLRAEATMAELELAEQTRLVARIDEFQRAWEARWTLVRTNVLNVPQRAVLRLLGEHSETTFKHTLREELVTALKTAAESKIDLSEDEDEDHDGP